MVGALANSPNSGLVITANGAAVAHRNVIIALAARHKLPAVYWQRHFVEAGGLVSYGEDGTDQYRRAAGYVDRILQGERAGRPTRTSADQVRDGDQPQDRQGAWARRCRRRCSPAPTR